MKNFLFFTRIFRVMVLCCVMLTIPSAFASVEAQNKAKAAQFMTQSVMGFEENKGQIIDQNNQPNTAVHYLFRSPGLHVQLLSNGFSYDSYRDEVLSPNKEESPLFMMGHDSQGKHKELSENKQITRHFHRVDIELVGASSNPEIVTGESYPTTHNYYTHNQGIENVRSYATVMYKNIYPNIDLEFFISTEGKPEYQFYVRPGGDAKQIRLRYNGALKTHLADGKIIMDVSHGSISEHIPLSYLANSKKEVTVQYVQNGYNEFTCKVPSYSSTETLIIDPMPQLSWGTYFGGDNIYSASANAIARDNSNNIFIAGWTISSTNIATTGAHQTTYSGGQDAFLAKFDNNGVLQWATYYGGTGEEFGNGIATDGDGNVYLVGSTNSTDAIATTGSHQLSFGGNQDGYIVKFNSNGVRQWGTYYGGAGNDAVRSVSVDANNDVIIAGTTNSTDAIATTGSHQSSFGGNQDGYIVKFTGNGVRQWATYYGGAGEDQASDIASDGSGNMYIVGRTASTASIATTGSHQSSLAFGIDAFIVKFNSNGVRQWGTYYGGSGWDFGFAISLDAYNNVFISGETFFGYDGIASPGSHQSSFGGNFDAFLVKFNENGIRQWGTYYGGAGDDSGADIALDANGNVYMAGITGSFSSIAHSNAYQTSSAGGDDGFIVKFDQNGVRQWGTYYGGEAADRARAIVLDTDSAMYVTGFTWSTTGIATAGSHQENRMGTPSAFLAKFTQIIPPSAISDIITTEGFGYTENIPYHLYQSNSLTSANSLALMGLTIRDGGEYGDEDNLPTILTSLSLSLTNHNYVRKVALFDGDTKIAETNAGTTVTFSDIDITVNDNTSKHLLLRVTFTDNVLDNAQITATVSAVTENSTEGSSFLNDDGSVPGLQYCESEMPYSGDGYGMYISEIQFADMMNASDAPASTALTYFSDKTANVTAGQTYTFVGTTNPLNQDFFVGMAVWIDYDQSGTFELSEKVFASEDVRLGTDMPFSTSVTIPADAVSGMTRMRVMIDYETLGGDMMPCTDMAHFGYGEVEDYNVFIMNGIQGRVFGPAQSSVNGDVNRIEVTADRLRFVQQPSDVNVGIAMQPDVTVEAIDEFNNSDRDVEGREVFITNRMLNDAPVAALMDQYGIATFGTLTFHTPSLLEQLTASSPGYESALSNSFEILCTGLTANTIAHFDAASISSTDGTPLAMWGDVACYNDNAVQNNSASRPYYRNNVMDNINNYPVVGFSFGRALSIAGRNELNGGSEKTLFAVFRTGSQVISRQVITELGGISSGFNMYIQNSRLYAGAWDNASLWVSQPIAPNRVYLAQFVYDGTRLRLSLSEQSGSTISTQSPFNDNYITALIRGNGIGSVFQQTRYHSGVNISAGHSDFFTNRIAEIIIMNSADVSERNIVFDILNTKYNIGASGNPLLKENEEEILAENTEQIPSVSVYPNPVQSSSSIIYQIPVSGHYTLLLQDVLGNTVMEIVKATQTAGTYSTELQADALLSGMYRLVLTTATGSISTPVVIQK